MDQSDFWLHMQDLLARIEPLLPDPCPPIDWQVVLAARWDGRARGLRALQTDLDMHLQDLQGLERQCRLLDANTRQFLRGWPANHALLTGARGTGKSSLVRALLTAHAASGLRLVEVARDDLVALPQLLALLRDQPWRFVVFCDDLSFASGEIQYRALKTLLDGSVETAPENVLLYATSNRRHLLPQMMRDNVATPTADGEVHPGESIEEQVALSDRFGLWVSFHAFSQNQYLDTVWHWIKRYSADTPLQPDWNADLQQAALRWATAHGNRNGRCAAQFARHWVGLQLLEAQL